jgi:hypothetical protein
VRRARTKGPERTELPSLLRAGALRIFSAMIDSSVPKCRGSRLTTAAANGIEIKPIILEPEHFWPTARDTVFVGGAANNEACLQGNTAISRHFERGPLWYALKTDWLAGWGGRISTGKASKIPERAPSAHQGLLRQSRRRPQRDDSRRSASRRVVLGDGAHYSGPEGASHSNMARLPPMRARKD